MQPPSSSSLSTGAWRAVRRWVVPHRLALFVGMWLVMVLVPPAHAPYGVQQGNRPNFQNRFVDGWLRWDVNWYWHIARDGYTNVPEVRGDQRDTNFFPLLPLFTRIVSLFTRNLYVAGMLVTNVAFLLAAFLLYKLAALRQGEEVAERVLILLLVYPFSFIFSAMYTESLFLLATVATFYFGEEERWGWAALAASLAGLTRVPGVLVPFGLGLLYLEKIRFHPRRLRWNALWVLAGVAGPVAYMGYLWARFGDPLLFVKTQQVAGWMGGTSYHDLLDIAVKTLSFTNLQTGNVDLVPAFGLLVSVLAAVACGVCLQRGRIAYGLWGLVTIAVSLKLPASLGRYTMLIFPLYLVSAERLKGAGLTFVATASSLFGVLMMLMWSHWIFVC